MEGWRTVLMEGYTTTKDKADTQIQKLKIKLANVLPKKRCVQCGATCMLGDLLELKTSQQDTCNHPHCFDCLQEQYERQRGYNEQELSDEVAQFALLNNVILCTKCLLPAVVVQLSSVATGFSQTKSGTACVQFKMIPDLTDKLRECLNCQVVDHYENQRRGLFGRFKDGKLLPIVDSRGHQSNQRGERVEISEIEKLEEGWVWLNKWCRDSDVGDPSGWQYAFNWPQTGCLAKNAQWENAPSNSTFVRHRRMLRSKIRLIPELKERKVKRSNNNSLGHAQELTREESLVDAALSFTSKPSSSITSKRVGSAMFAPATMSTSAAAPVKSLEDDDPSSSTIIPRSGGGVLDQPLMTAEQQSEAMDHDDGGAIGLSHGPPGTE